MKSNIFRKILFAIIFLLVCYANKTMADVEVRHAFSDSSSPNRFIIVDRKSDNYAKAALFCINRGKIVKSDEISISTDWKICKSYCTFRDNILGMIIIKTSDEDKSKIRSSFYGFPFFSGDERIDKGYDFYEWPASVSIEPSFYPSNNKNETLITDIYLGGLNGIVNVFDIWYLGKDFYGNITQNKVADVPLNPLLSPDGSLLSVIIQEDDRIGFYVISTDRKLKKDEVKWNNFV
ncbi:MAG: hypothetical protein LWY06_06470, partial [Firmicutes bacterium]|nr:hypothetical protein [Bacillota bacterium]